MTNATVTHDDSTGMYKAIKNLRSMSHASVDLWNASGGDQFAESSEQFSADERSAKGGGRSSLDQALAANETKVVRRLKGLVFLLLLTTTVLVGWAVFEYTSRAENAAFEEKYDEDARKVLSTLGANMNHILESLDSFAVAMVSFARYSNQTWPFVVIPDFAVRAERIRTLSKAVYVNIYTYVEKDQRKEWERWASLEENNYWVDETISLMDANPDNQWPIVKNYTRWDVIYGYEEWDKENPGVEGTNTSGPWLPLWQSMPVIPYDPPYNWGLNTIPDHSSSDSVFESHKVALSEAYLINGPDTDPDTFQENIDEADWISSFLTTDEDPMAPISDYYYPIIDDNVDSLSLFEEDYDVNEHRVVALLSVSVYWRDALKDILPDGSEGMVMVFNGECNPSFTYEINGGETRYLGAGDLHDTRYDDMEISAVLNDLVVAEMATQGGRPPLNDEKCIYFVSMYPSEKMENQFVSNKPVYYTVLAVSIFAFTAAVFVLYDWYVERRHRMVKAKAVQSTAIVDSLFPAAVQERIANEIVHSETPTSKLNKFLNVGNPQNMSLERSESIKGKPIAELFSDTTVLFADIVGFTGWSSEREPSQVFTLLETLYAAFDAMAKRHQIFKVETIGDCYVAVAGLPEPNKNHAVAMCKFAVECLRKIKSVVRELEPTLGPGTGSLMLRAGMHSGPTTAGVLRGEKARFQLFGDTVNTASRMETTGLPDRIQLSEKTASLLIASGKRSWIVPREEKVTAKGKGLMQTYFLKSASTKSNASTRALSVDSKDTASESGQSGTSRPDADESSLSARNSVLVNWSNGILETLLSDIVAQRGTGVQPSSNEQKTIEMLEIAYDTQDRMFTEEAMDVIAFPQGIRAKEDDSDKIQQALSPSLLGQLKDYVGHLADAYNAENPFHNFEHACHVLMSAMRLLQRVETRGTLQGDDDAVSECLFDDYMRSVAMNPLTKFGIMLSALIGEIDHPGLPANAVLVREQPELARVYGENWCAAEHSFEFAWNLLMEPAYDELRGAIYTTEEELRHFRQVLVNCVATTDMFDQNLNAAREQRWSSVFPASNGSEDDGEKTAQEKAVSRDDWNKKATAVIEAIVRASEISHTMQHWHVYQSWSRRKYDECCKAYESKQIEANPSESWYEQELFFFDNYTIPLAKKLQQCKVLGRASEQLLGYAQSNRKQWSISGAEVIEDFKTKMSE